MDHVKVTMQTASPKLLAKFQAIRDTRSHFPVNMRTAYVFLERRAEFERLRKSIAETRQLRCLPNANELSDFCVSTSVFISELLESRFGLTMIFVAPFAQIDRREFDRQELGVGDELPPTLELDYKNLAIRFFYVKQELEEREKKSGGKIDLAVIFLGLFKSLMKTSSPWVRIAGQPEFLTVAELQTYLVTDGETRDWHLPPGEKSDLTDEQLFNLIRTNAICGQRVCGLKSDELHLFSVEQLFNQAVNERTLNTLYVEHQIALALVYEYAFYGARGTLQEESLPVGELLENAIRHQKELVEERKVRVSRLKELNAPDVIIGPEKEFLWRGKRLLLILQKNRSWLLEMLSK